MIPDIAQLGAEVLRRPALPVSDVHADDTVQTIAHLQATLATTEGVGIAAPQIRVSQRIIIVASRPTRRYPHAPAMAPTVMINPSFKPDATRLDKDWEGCLSIPGIRARVPRYHAVVATFTDPQGRLQTIALEGFVARVFQHEYDHLDGKVYLDRVESSLEIISETEYYRYAHDLGPRSQKNYFYPPS